MPPHPPAVPAGSVRQTCGPEGPTWHSPCGRLRSIARALPLTLVVVISVDVSPLLNRWCAIATAGHHARRGVVMPSRPGQVPRCRAIPRT